MDVVREYVQRRISIENEITLLHEDLKALDEEFSEKIDVAILKAALAIKRREDRVRAKACDTYDNMRIALNELDA